MKLVQLARPLFLVALGLHALVLFIPTGDESETVVIEDVPFSEESESAEFSSKSLSAKEAPGDQLSDQLPDADSNALVAASRKSPKPIALPPAAIATRTASPRAASTQSARRASSPANPSSNGVPNLPVGNTNLPSVRSPSESTQANATPANSSPSNRPPTNIIPDLSSQSDRPSATTAERATSPSIATLIANLAESVSVSKALLKEVSDLSKSLAYREKNTDDNSANQNRVDWKADIQRQANVGTVESLAPTEILGLTEIAYPIEVSKQADMAGRSLSLCLEVEPHGAEVGVLFDSQGNIASEPSLIRSTGYDALNKEIIATIRSYQDFPPNRNSKAYLLEFEVDYDAKSCVSLKALKEQSE